MSTYRERCREAVPDVPFGQGYTVPNPASGRSWVDDGVEWRLRGGMLSPRHARRLLSEPEVRVMHVYDHPAEDLPGLDAHLEEFWNGEADPQAERHVYEFRAAERARMAMVVESC